MARGDLGPWFPCWLLTFDTPLEDARSTALHLNEVNSEGGWCLASTNALSSERQAWAALVSSRSNEEHGSMKGRGIETEFLRHVAGTHHIDMAFKDAGISTGDSSAWLIHLPGMNPGDGPDVQLPSLDWRELEHEAWRLARALGADISPNRPGSPGINAEQEDESRLLQRIAAADSLR